MGLTKEQIQQLKELDKIDFSKELFKKGLEIVDDNIDGKIKPLIEQNEKFKICMDCFDVINSYNWKKYIKNNDIDLNIEDYEDYDLCKSDDSLTINLAYELYIKGKIKL